jgi:hypothetical protein
MRAFVRGCKTFVINARQSLYQHGLTPLYHCSVAIA